VVQLNRPVIGRIDLHNFPIGGTIDSDLVGAVVRLLGLEADLGEFPHAGP
jgi:hypothetical protein